MVDPGVVDFYRTGGECPPFRLSGVVRPAENNQRSWVTRQYVPGNDRFNILIEIKVTGKWRQPTATAQHRIAQFDFCNFGNKAQASLDSPRQVNSVYHFR